MSEKTDNLKMVLQHIETINRGEMGAAAEFYAEDARNHGRPAGRSRVLLILKDIQRTFPDVQQIVLDSVTEGEWVVVRCRFTGTHSGVGQLPVNGGMLVGVPPTGRHFEVQHIHMYKVVSNKIVDHYANRDDLGMMQQLGLIGTQPSAR